MAKLARPADESPESAPPPPRRTEPAAPEEKPEPIGRRIRGWADALVFAFLLAMFIRTYVFELYMIPTGSMTPALIGDDMRLVSEMDWDGDGTLDIVTIPPMAVPTFIQVHLRDDEGRFGTQLFLDNPKYEVAARFAEARQRAKGRRDMIMVNKFAYWFSPPDRGDIAIFKFPDRPERGSRFDPLKPVYIKRCAGLPGEVLEVQAPSRYEVHPVGDSGRRTPDEIGGVEWVLHSNPLLANGKPVTEAPFNRLHHFPVPGYWAQLPATESMRFQIGPDEVYMFGDNQMSSSDSRYWGGVPLAHLRGRAILRYIPLPQFGFLTDDK